MSVRAISKFLIAFGVIMVVIAMQMNTTHVGYYNIGLLSEQQNLLGIGGLAFLAGVFLFATSKNIQPQQGTSGETNESETPRPSFNPESPDAYNIWLVSHYKITKNEVLEGYVCEGRVFPTKEEVLEYARALDAKALEETELTRMARRKLENVSQMENSLRNAAEDRITSGQGFWIILLVGMTISCFFVTWWMGVAMLFLTFVISQSVIFVNKKDAINELDNLKRAAEQGDDVAQSELGYAYTTGKGVLKDDVIAANWYRLAAEQENSTAQFHLGNAYENGLGVAKSPEDAIHWYRLSAAQGVPDAKAKLDLLLAGKKQ
jgi:hypothetical protein